MKLIIAIAGLLIFMYPGKKGKTVLLDSYYNNESRDDGHGKPQSWHYKWEEEDNNGFSLLGSVFKNYAVDTQTCYSRPTAAILKRADIYIIVDPDIPKENPAPKYIEPDDVQTIYDWVKTGGVLVMLGNDTGNAEFDHFNTLAQQFGIQFNKNSRNHVEDSRFETGGINIPAGNIIFKKVKKIYVKDISTLSITDPAKAVLTDKGDVIMAIAKLGKGTVFALGDPWLYNEYTDGKKLPEEYQNYDAAKEWVQWLISHVPKDRNKL